jgi:hypothetical protein
MRLRALIITSLLTVALAGSATAAHRITLHNTKTFTLAAGKTKTFKVEYPDALKYGGSAYSGKVHILTPVRGAQGSTPSLTKVHVLNEGPAFGGSVFAVMVHNANRAGTAPVRVRVTATTVLPPETSR